MLPTLFFLPKIVLAIQGHIWCGHWAVGLWEENATQGIESELVFLWQWLKSQKHKCSLRGCGAQICRTGANRATWALGSQGHPRPVHSFSSCTLEAHVHEVWPQSHVLKCWQFQRNCGAGSGAWAPWSTWLCGEGGTYDTGRIWSSGPKIEERAGFCLFVQLDGWLGTRAEGRGEKAAKSSSGPLSGMAIVYLSVERCCRPLQSESAKAGISYFATLPMSFLTIILKIWWRCCEWKWWWIILLPLRKETRRRI